MHTNRGLKLAMEDLGGGTLLKKKYITEGGFEVLCVDPTFW